MSIPPTFLVFDAFVRTKTFDHWKKGGVWGELPSEAEKNANFKLNCKI